MGPEVARYRSNHIQRGEGTRRRILETAIEVFAAYEYDGASTRMLAERAGVNLPAIQYYFGSKEGLYRAAIAHIIQHIENHMAPVAQEVAATLAERDCSRPELLALLYRMLDAFTALVLSGDQPEARKRLIARAEAECTGALDPLHASTMRHVFGPCQILIGRLIGRAEDDEQTALRTMTILGQVSVFCNEGARRRLCWSAIDDARVRAVQALVREQTDAIFSVIGSAP